MTKEGLNMKRLFSLILCLCLILVMVPAETGFGATENTRNMEVAQYQYYTATGVVANTGGGGVNVRKGPSGSYDVCTVLREGTKVYIVEKDYMIGWHQIYYKGYYGYVMSQYIGQIKDITTASQRESLGYGVAVPFGGGSGTKGSPYIVNTPAQLNSIRFGMNKYYKLGKDIDLKYWGQWLPIGDTQWYCGRQSGVASARDAKVFIGQLDGDGHVIKNMTITINRDTPTQPASEGLDTRHYGLFGMVGSNNKSNVVIQNLGIVDPNINIKYNKINCQLWAYVGALAGNAQVSTIKHCWTKGGNVNLTVNRGTQKKYAQPNDANVQIAGLVGSAAEQKFVSCGNTANVKFSTTRMKGKSKSAGGITTSGNYIFIDKCFNKGSITMPKSSTNNANIGGLMSWLCNPISKASDFGHIYDSYNTGKISGGYFAGGLVGYTSIGIKLNRCYSTGKVLNAKYKGTLYPAKTTKVKSKASCYTSGKSVTGSAWTTYNGRKILKSIPENKL